VLHVSASVVSADVNLQPFIPNITPKHLLYIFKKNQQNSMTMANNKELSAQQREESIEILKTRFEKNINRHTGILWSEVQSKLEGNKEKLWSLNQMEVTGGEPDVSWPGCKYRRIYFLRLLSGKP
jgi:hypothetical protein